jgi:tetratricopeptide (TPR) repeat protein
MAGILEVLPDDLERMGNAHYHLGKLELATGDPVTAEAEFRALVALRERLGKAQDWRAPNLESCIGAALTAQGRFDEAEAQLLPATEALLARDDLPPLDSRQGDVGGVALERVVSLYQKWSAAEADPRLEAELQRWTQRLSDWRDL